MFKRRSTWAALPLVAGLPAAAIMFTSGLVLPAVAAAEDAKNIGIEEIVVTARKREEAAQDVLHGELVLNEQDARHGGEHLRRPRAARAGTAA